MDKFYQLIHSCDPDWIRTNDHQLRRLMLYPTELPDLFPIRLGIWAANIGHNFLNICKASCPIRPRFHFKHIILIFHLSIKIKLYFC